AFTGTSLNLTEPTFDTEVETILKKIDPSLELAKETDAEEHFDNSLKTQLLGSWLYSEGPGQRNVLTFIDEAAYIIIHEHDVEPNDPKGQRAGSVEFGFYEWNPRTEEFSVDLGEYGGESDGFGGLYDEGSSVVAAKLQGTTLTLTVREEEGDDEVSFTRVSSPTNPLIGAWFL